MSLLHAKNISHTFDYPLFEDINLEIQEQDSIAIIGVSGSGKSTLLHILSTLLEANQGSVELFGQNVKDLKQKELMKLKRDDIGIVFQQHYLFKGFSAFENLEVASILAQEPIEEELLKKLKIEKVVHQKVTELSGGQQQRISLARVLTKKPKLIFADEPTGNLDKETAQEVIALLLEYVKKHNAAIVLVTHDEHLANLCDNVYKLENLQLISQK